MLGRLFKKKSRHEHNFVVLLEIKHAPVEGGRHTSYFLMKCALCPETLIFGEDNFKLTTPEHQKTLCGFAESHGLKLELKLELPK